MPKPDFSGTSLNSEFFIVIKKSPEKMQMNFISAIVLTTMNCSRKDMSFQ